MSDWRLNGQENYLTNAVLYQVIFPDFWRKSYAEKNPFYQKIAEYAQRYVAEHNKDYQQLEGEKVQGFWHEHCEFCWSKATTDTSCVFYCTKDLKYWICEECFSDFYAQFGWTVRPVSELFDPDSDNDGLTTVYDHLKDHYDIILTNTAALDEGFTIDCPIIVGKAHGLILELYKDGKLFVMDIMDAERTKGTHWHPNDVETAVEDIVAFMEGKEDYELMPFKQPL